VWLWGELTESAAMVGDPNVLANIVRLNERGIRVAIDDFGTGYSSFARLRHLPVAGIKIDRAFVSGVDTDPVGQTLVRTQVAIANSLDMFIIAEGVETDGERLALMEQGVEFGQGFGLHRPMPAEQLIELLASNPPFPT
jgi:EAL domain-containing protein (putative c-di-GMP-specific phosphodiesterase class I)